MNEFGKFRTLKVQKKSGFDKSYRNLLTMPVGTLVPIFVDELIPNTTVHLSENINACLPPLATDAFMNVNLKTEAFFVPSRLCYGGFEQWLTGEKAKDVVSNTFKTPGIPYMRVTGGSAVTGYCCQGSLADYLGCKLNSSDLAAYTALSPAPVAYFNIFPFLAYHLIWDTWYRNSLIQNSCFARLGWPSGGTPAVYNLPYATTYSNSTYFALSSQLADGVAIGSLRQRNFGIDLFTSCQATPQLGSDSKVEMTNGTLSDGTTGSTLTIKDLRLANSLQQFMERNQLAGFKLQDYVRANYGANLTDGVANRPLYLGSHTINVYTKGVNFTSQAQGSGTYNNPFAEQVGASAGQAVCCGNGTMVESFTAEEPGYLFIIASIVPEVTYSNGISPMLMRYNAGVGCQVDMANPILQNTGNEEVCAGQLYAMDYLTNTNTVFGYNDRYSSWMTRPDELHGLVRDGYSLDAFALQRTFASAPQINSAFLTIPKTYLDQVSVATTGISSYGAWLDCYFDYKVSMPLAQYSTPTLQDPAYEHGKSVTIRKGGSRID